MNRQIIIATAISILTAYAAHANTNFNIPLQCTQGATGAASNTLATDGDPPAVNIYRFSGSQDQRTGSILSTYRDEKNNWFVTFTVPQTDYYTIYTEYTPFLVTYQSEAYYQGQTYQRPLAQPGQIRESLTVASFDVNLGSELPNAYIEFTADISTVGPLTMQVDANGLIRLYCYTIEPNGQPITVYDQNYEFVGTGVLNDNGRVTWNKPEDAKPAQVQRLSSPPQGSKRANREGT
jgi:hypothetical protein